MATKHAKTGQPATPGAAEPAADAPIVRAGPACLRVSARVDGFRRCGRAWPASGAVVATADFSDAQVATLLADPDLVVAEVLAPE